jgi:hypothetical protein
MPDPTPPQRKLLRLLIVDDDPGGTSMLIRYLRGAGLQVWHERVDSGPALKVVLETRTWDAILCEYRFKGFSAAEALAIARSFPQDIPFIVVSGSILEDAAVDLLRTGAHDFVSRRNLDRLAPAIVREVAEAQGRSERLRAESALRESEAMARTILQTAADAILTTDADGRIETMNPAGYRLFRIPDPPPRELKISTILGHSTLDPLLEVLRAMAGGAPDAPAELTALRFDGTTAPVEVTVSAMSTRPDAALLCFVRDVSRRRSLEEQVRRSQKLDALGHLAAGIAHDFNNVLNIVLAHAELGLATVIGIDKSPSEPLASVREDLSQIVHASERGASITKRLLVFSRRGPVSPRVIDLRSVIREMYEMLAPCVGPKISFTQELGDTPCVARVDPGFLEQSVLNLVVNARDAMTEGGPLVLSLRRVDLPLGDVIAGVTIPPGAHIELALRDSGHGMTPDIIAKIFEPFFTTKSVGHGTGLGLATVYGFVQQSSGQIAVESQPGKGSTFSIFLPETSEPMDLTVDDHSTPRSRGNETVLLVEDNDMLRVATRRLLENHGYRVLEAASHVEVLARCRSFEGSINLLLSDIMLPDIDGISLAGKARELRSSLRVLLMTGYFEPTQGRAIPYPLLQKPCSASILLHAVRNTLDATVA